MVVPKARNGSRISVSSGETMRFSLIAAFLACGLIALASPVLSAGAPPPSAQVGEVEALVKKAAAEIEQKGTAAFTEFRKKDSTWFHGDTYVFAYNQDGVVLLNPAFP